MWAQRHEKRKTAICLMSNWNRSADFFFLKLLDIATLDGATLCNWTRLNTPSSPSDRKINDSTPIIWIFIPAAVCSHKSRRAAGYALLITPDTMCSNLKVIHLGKWRVTRDFTLIASLWTSVETFDGEEIRYSHTHNNRTRIEIPNHRPAFVVQIFYPYLLRTKKRMKSFRMWFIGRYISTRPRVTWSVGGMTTSSSSTFQEKLPHGFWLSGGVRVCVCVGSRRAAAWQ